MKFLNFTLLQIYQYLEKNLKNKGLVTIKLPLKVIENETYSIKDWADLAEIFEARLLIPKIDSDFIELQFKKLNTNNSFHNQNVKNKREKYGSKSGFWKIKKHNRPYFLHSFKQALEFADFKKRKNILNLGINRGDEFEFIKELAKDEFKNLNLTGVDHSESAIEFAKKSLNYPNCKFYCHDILKLEQLNLPKQDLIISISTLQSPDINYKLYLSRLLQEFLSPSGALIIAFPNGRWLDNTLIYGAKVKNYSFSELGVVCSDIVWIKKYLQQKKFKVIVTGKEYLFVTAVKKMLF